MPDLLLARARLAIEESRSLREARLRLEN